jgi:hypothetical protein
MEKSGFLHFVRSRRYFPVFCILVALAIVIVPRRLDPHFSFQDTRTVTHSIDCVELGKDPYVQTCDPWNRLFNYPPVWLELRHVGMDSKQTNLMGYVLALVSLSSFLYLFRSRSLLRSSLTLLALFSFPFFFAVRLGNIDQAVFALLIIGIAVAAPLKGTARDWGMGALICVLTVLKVYPIAAVFLFLRDRHGMRKALLTAAASVAALVLTSRYRLPQYLKNTPHDTKNSFGAYTSTKLMWEAVPFVNHTLLDEHSIARLATLLAMIAGALAAFAGMRYRERLLRWVPPLTASTAHGTAAIAGMVIFCFAFVLSSSYDYRMIFLLPALALMLDDTLPETRVHGLSPVAYLFILSMMLPWAAFRPERESGILVLIISLVHAMLFLVCVAWLASWLGSVHPRRKAMAELRTA